MTKRRHARFHRQKNALLETCLEVFVILFPEITQYLEVGTMQVRNEHKTQILMASLLYLARTKNPMTVCINQNTDVQSGMIGILTKNAVLLLDAGCINLLEYIFIDVAFMICRKKIK